MMGLKVTQIGNSLGVILPKELLVKLGSGKGERCTPSILWTEYG